jgi:ATP-dependent Clp protease ATP-binding subunit ClpA
MLDNPSAAEVLKRAASTSRSSRAFSPTSSTSTPRVWRRTATPTRSPRKGFQRVIQRAILHVQSSGKKEVTGANVLVAIFGEKESHAVYFLNQRGVTRLDVVNYIAHGITKSPQHKQDKSSDSKEDGEGGSESQGALDAYT